jgi:hypothetical protein
MTRGIAVAFLTSPADDPTSSLPDRAIRDHYRVFILKFRRPF